MAAQFANQGADEQSTTTSTIIKSRISTSTSSSCTRLSCKTRFGSYQQALGQADQGFAQAQLDAQQLAAREAEFEPFTRLGLVGQQLAQIQPGAFPTTTVGYQSSAAPASPLSSFLGGAAGAGGVLGKLGIFG